MNEPYVYHLVLVLYIFALYVIGMGAITRQIDAITPECPPPADLVVRYYESPPQVYPPLL